MKNRIFKITICAAFSLFLALIFSFAAYAVKLQQSFDADLYGNVIRLHILANSDSETDQNAKIAVRNDVLQYIASLTDDAKDADSAIIIVNNELENIEKYVSNVCRNLGYSYDVNASLCEEYYPVRYYDNFAFPAGTYNSLKITLGSGKGKNWWCVLYPSVCTAAAADYRNNFESAGISAQTASAVCSEKPQVQFGMFILDLFDGKN